MKKKRARVKAATKPKAIKPITRARSVSGARRKAPAPNAADKRKAPAGRGKPTGARRDRSQGPKPAVKASPKLRPPVKSRATRKPAPELAPKPAKPAKPVRLATVKPTRTPLPKTPAKPAKISKHPEAARSRRRRAIERERERAEELKREARNRKARERRQRRKPRAPIDEQDLARGWLEMIRERISEVFSVDLSITVDGGGAARPQDREAQSFAGPTPWMIVGRFDPLEIVDYQILARGLQIVIDDLIIEASINPERLSQLRILFSDPTSTRGEADSVLSHIGAWSFILGDAIGDLVGTSADSPDEDSLAARYDETTVRCFYIFFSRELVSYTTVTPTKLTQEFRLR